MALMHYNKRYPVLSRIWNNDLPNIFEDILSSDFDMDIGLSKVPQINIREEEKSYIIDVASPGREKKDFDIKVQDGILTVKGSKKDSNETSNKRYHKREISYSSFQKSYELPDNIDQEKVSANYKDGILSIVIPKKEEQPSSSVRIDIQ